MITPTKAKKLYHISILVMVFSVPWFVVGIIFAVRTHLFIQSAIHAKGIIVELEQRRSDEGSTVYSPVCTFTDVQGNTHKVSISIYSNPAIVGVGDEIEVLYDPDNPQKVRINRFLYLRTLEAIFTAIGVSYLVLFLWLALYAKRKMKSEQPILGGDVPNGRA